MTFSQLISPNKNASQRGGKAANETKSALLEVFPSCFWCFSGIPDLRDVTFGLVLVLVRQMADSCPGDELHIRRCIHLKKMTTY